MNEFIKIIQHYLPSIDDLVKIKQYYSPIIDDITEMLRHYSPLFSILTLFLGLYLGNRFAINRIKKQEINEYAKRLINYFDYIQCKIEKQEITTPLPLPKGDIDILISKISSRKQKSFEALVYRYQSTFNQLNNEKNRTDKTYNLLLKQLADIKHFLRLK
ncbi:hypothetical protein [Candidatus Arsenophonus triatominarum]|uniref:hypothetical protein n=1 Tax=Candidatus Arsenophonus triatominarum TaxID=57911 RepID=UPI0007C443C5|nr:hypothetical protein [Candidatus Arsenophonus triatominarum]